MKVSVTQANLNKALSVVGKIVGSRSTLPVLGNVLLTTDANRLKISSTNLEMGINTWIGAKVEENGALTVPARLFSEFVSSVGGANLVLTKKNQVLHLESERSESHINGIDAKEFPSIPEFKKTNVFSIDSAQLKLALSQVVGAASFDDTRPVLNGVYMYTEDDHITLVATDSYRLAEKIISLGAKSKTELKINVPARTIQELLRMLDDESGMVEIIAEESQVLFRLGDIELISRLIEGQYPDYRQLIPTDSVAMVEIGTKELQGAAKVASLFARESGGSVNLALDVKKQLLDLSATASQVGDANSNVKAKLSGENETISLNSRYLLDALSVMRADDIKIEVTGKVNPFILRPKTKDSNYLHLIMPLRS